MREISASVGATLQLTELVELGLRAIRTLCARKDLRHDPFDIWLKSAFSSVHHEYLGSRRFGVHMPLSVVENCVVSEDRGQIECS